MNADLPACFGITPLRVSMKLVLHLALRMPRVMILVAAALMLTAGCGGREVTLTPDDSAGNGLASLVDSEPARRLLVDLLARKPTDPRLAALAPSLLGTDVVAGVGTDLTSDLGQVPDQQRLRELAQRVSLDFAALAFARRVGGDERSSGVQAAFERFVQDGAPGSEEALRLPGAFPYTVLFAPAWLYRSHPENGSDFARQRRLLDRLGIANRLIESGESESVEDNARVIAGAVREAGRNGETPILVSTSKSGAEVALALSRLLEPWEAATVAGWVNVAGALRGTPLVDAALRTPRWWMTRFVLWTNGWNPAGVSSMATALSRERLEGARLPNSIAVVNLIAVPVSGSVGFKVWWGYQVLRRHGPNDGVVLLADTVWPGGFNLVALGADHLFSSHQEDMHCLALLRVADIAVRLQRARASGMRFPTPVLP